MKLFEDKIRNRLSYANHTESAYDFYDSSALPDMIKIREMLNDWFDLYPNNEKGELKARFGISFDSAFYELFLYILFYKIGFEIIIHPELDGSTKKPDFLIKNENIEFYLEAKIDKDKSRKEEAYDNSINQLYDRLSKVQTQKYLLHINDIKLKNSQQPETKNLIKSIESWLDSLDFSSVYSLSENGKIDELPRFTVDNDKLKLELLPTPMAPKFHGDSGESPLGMYPMQSFWGGPEKSLKKAISRKAKRYGCLDKPYLIAINEMSAVGITEQEIYNVIFGTLHLTYDYKSLEKPSRATRAKNGLIIDKNGFKNQNVNGFFITKVNPHNLHIAEYWLIKHPQANFQMDFNELPFCFKYVMNNNIKTKEGNSIKQIIL